MAGKGVGEANRHGQASRPSPVDDPVSSFKIRPWREAPLGAVTDPTQSVFVRIFYIEYLFNLY